MKSFGKTVERIDNNIIHPLETERLYWVNVLKRVVVIVKTYKHLEVCLSEVIVLSYNSNHS